MMIKKSDMIKIEEITLSKGDTMMISLVNKKSEEAEEQSSEEVKEEEAEERKLDITHELQPDHCVSNNLYGFIKSLLNTLTL